MMQPRDAHDDGDCAMEEAGGATLLQHSSPLPAAVMTPVTTNSKTDASSPSSSNQQQTNEEIREAADAQLVGARKRKAIRVVKHQQQQVSLNLNFYIFKF
jgi:hypothetical protein